MDDPSLSSLLLTTATTLLASRDSNNDNDNDTNKLENWYVDTPPFDVVRHFARDEVTGSTIHEALQHRRIKTLEDLYRRNSHIVPLLKEDVNSFFTEAIRKAYMRVRKTPEEILGGQVIYDEKCIPKGCLALYADEAVAVEPKTMSPLPNFRKQEFTLVLGPSGSGKTLFALKRLPALLTESKVCKTENVFSVHFQAVDAAAVKTMNNLSFPDAVASVVNDKINIKLEELGLAQIKHFKVTLHVVIDEAGKESLKDFFSSADLIQAIVNSIKTKISTKFDEVHVTAVGTGLETTTDDIESFVETIKFRMQPWTMENFEALVKQSSHSDKLVVIAIVKKFPILQDLLTNARCAFFLLQSMANLWLLRKNRQKSMVNVLITSVADYYIVSNGLQILRAPEERWAVARSVFWELDKAARNPGIPFIPEFKDLAIELRSVASSVLDIHVETRRGVPKFLSGSQYSLSMSPALVLVMANLLNKEADISWDWQGFESNVLLSEMKRMVVQSTGTPKNLDRLCLQLLSPLPAGSAKYSFAVPLVDKYTVVMNGPMAKYADVIAPYRLVQAKFSKNDSNPRELSLQDELDKMGLTNSKGHELQQMITSVLYTLWQYGGESPLPIQTEATQTVNKDRRYECYPFNILNSRIIFHEPLTVRGDASNDLWQINGGGLDISKILSEFHESHPVTAVFATNCGGFRLKRKKGDNSLSSITPDDVDYEGKLNANKQLEDYGLRDNVQIRFLFF